MKAVVNTAKMATPVTVLLDTQNDIVYGMDRNECQFSAHACTLIDHCWKLGEPLPSSWSRIFMYRRALHFVVETNW